MNGLVNVRLEPVVLADVLLAVHKNPVEISGLIKAERNSDLLYTIKEEPLIIEQECSITHTNFTLPYGHWTQRMMRENPNWEKEIKAYRCWFHSHPHGDVYFSTIDQETIEGWNRTIDEWWLSWVLNKRGKMAMRLDIFIPERKTVFPIRRVELTEQAGKEDVRRLMVERSARMDEILQNNVRIVGDEGKPFERILKGVFGE